MLEPPQLEFLQIWDIGGLPLRLVTDRKGISVHEALAENYLMVDWGLTHSLQHRRLFPDAPEPKTRLASAAMTMSYIQSLGGAAYLPEVMTETAIKNRQLFLVEDAPLIEHRVHAIYPVRSGRKDLINKVLMHFQLD
jgi:hypothetical protein